MMTDYSNLEAALDTVRPGLNSDGFRLHLGDVRSNGNVTVVLEAKSDACYDCLVSDETLTQIVQAAIRRHGSDDMRVSLIKKDFELGNKR